MSFQGWQGEVDPKVGHEIPGGDDGTQVMQLMQVQLAQMVASSAVSQALTQQMQQIVNNPLLATAANHVSHSTTAMCSRSIQSPIKLDIPTFEGNNSTNWLTWSQKVVCQARACDFEAELTAAERQALSVEAAFYRSNVDPVRLQNAHVAWMTLINSCRGMTLKVEQRSKAPNDACRNLESYYRAEGTRGILRRSHKVSGKTMGPGDDSFKLMMETDRLRADLHRLSDKSVTELRKSVVMMAGLSANYEMKYSMLENNPPGLNRAEIECCREAVQQTYQATRLKGSIDIGRHHYGGSRQGEKQEIPHHIRG